MIRFDFNVVVFHHVDEIFTFTLKRFLKKQKNTYSTPNAMNNYIKKCITQPAAVLLCSVAMAATDYQLNPSTPTTINVANWSDIVWTSETDQPGQNRDRYYIDLNNATESNFYIKNGTNAVLENSAIYFRNYTNAVIGDNDGGAAASLKIDAINSGLDLFVEMSGRATLSVKKNGTLTLTANKGLRFYNMNNSVDPNRTAFLVDGGTVNGNFSVGSNVGDSIKVVFQNGATLNRNGEVNPLNMTYKSTLIFDNSTYNVYSNGWAGTGTTGWGHHVMNIGADNNTVTEITASVSNGSVFNGAGTVADNVVTYHDFNAPITSANMQGADLTLQTGRMKNDTDFFKFSITENSKVSAKKIILGSGDAVKSSTKGNFNFNMKGTSEQEKAMLAAFGGTSMNLSKAFNTNGESGEKSPIEDNSYQVNFKLEGNTSFQTVGGFSLGSSDTLGATGNFLVSGDNNEFTVAGFNVDAGSNNAQGLGSNAKINILWGDDGKGNFATNSTMSVSSVDIKSGANTDILFKVSGETNQFKNTGGITMENSTFIAGSSKSRFELATGQESTFAANFTLSNKASGLSELMISNGSKITVNSVSLNASNIEGGTAKSYMIIDGSSLTTNNDMGYGVGSGAKSGEVGIILQGENASFLAKGQMNINPGNVGNSGGTYAIKMLGKNGTFENQKNMHMSGRLEGNASYEILMQGEGNIAKFSTLSGANFNFGNDNSTGGLYSFKSQSVNAAAKNYVYLGGADGNGAYQIQLSGQMVADATTRREFVLAGNTVLRKGNNAGIILKMHEYAGMNYLSGTALFEVSGSGNDALFTDLLVGNGVSTGGNATFRVKGGGSKIETNNFRMQKGATTALDNRIGGILEFQVDDTGISTIQINNALGAIDGILTIDFSGMKGSYTDERFVLLSAKDSGLESKLGAYWIDFENDTVKSNAEIILRDIDGETYHFAVEKNTLDENYYDFVIYYSGVIPEPSTYAAILGAFALVLVAIRRRRK